MKKPTSIQDIKSMLTKWKVFGVIVGIILIALGVVSMVFPGAFMSVSIWLVIASFGIMAIYQIIRFIFDKDSRNGLTLTLAIITLIILLGIVLEFVFAEDLKEAFKADTVLIVAIIAMTSGVYTLMGGICGIFYATKATVNQGWKMAGAIMSVIMGFLLMFAPLYSMLAITILFGIYLIIIGFLLIFSVFVNKEIKIKKVKIKEDEVKSDDDVIDGEATIIDEDKKD